MKNLLALTAMSPLLGGLVSKIKYNKEGMNATTTTTPGQLQVLTKTQLYVVLIFLLVIHILAVIVAAKYHKACNKSALWWPLIILFPGTYLFLQAFIPCDYNCGNDSMKSQPRR